MGFANRNMRVELRTSSGSESSRYAESSRLARMTSRLASSRRIRYSSCTKVSIFIIRIRSARHKLHTHLTEDITFLLRLDIELRRPVLIQLVGAQVAVEDLELGVGDKDTRLDWG